MTEILNRYLSTSQGQLHARVAGEGSDVVLLHTTPGSGTQFEHVQPLLAERGYRSWALDLLGNGRSAALPHGYTFELAAQTIGEAIVDAGLSPVILVGGHMSAQMAIELISRQPAVATHLVVDGLPMWDRKTREHITSLFDNSPPAVDVDGSHIVEAWKRSIGLHQAWNQNLVLNEEGERRTTRAMIDTLESGMDNSRGVRAFVDYDVHPRLPNLSLPVLVTTATGDTLFDQHAATVAAIPGAREHTFDGPHPRHQDAAAQTYVNVLCDFFDP